VIWIRLTYEVNQEVERVDEVMHRDIGDQCILQRVATVMTELEKNNEQISKRQG